MPANTAASMRTRKIVCVSLYTLAFFLLGLEVNIVGPTASALARKLKVHVEDLGPIYTVSGLTCTLGAIPAGRLIDSLPGHVVLVLGILVQVTGLATMGLLAESLTSVIVFYSVASFTFNFINIGGNTLVAWVVPESPGPFMNLVDAGFGMGSFLGPALALLCRSWLGSKLWAYTAIAAFGGLVATLLLMVRSPAIGSAGKEPAGGSSTADSGGSQRQPLLAAAGAEGLLQDAGAAASPSGAQPCLQEAVGGEVLPAAAGACGRPKGLLPPGAAVARREDDARCTGAAEEDKTLRKAALEQQDQEEVWLGVAMSSSGRTSTSGSRLEPSGVPELYASGTAAAVWQPQEGGTAAAGVNWNLVVAVSVFVFFNIGTSIMVGAWVNTYAQKQAGLDDLDAAFVNSIYWGAFTFSRFGVVLLSTRLRPLQIIVPCIMMSALGASMLLLPPGLLPHLPRRAALSIAFFVAGVGFAPGFANGFAMVARHSAVTGTANSLISGASGLGTMVLPALAAALVKYTSLGWQAVVFVTLASQACQCLVVLWAATVAGQPVQSDASSPGIQPAESLRADPDAVLLSDGACPAPPAHPLSAPNGLENWRSVSLRASLSGLWGEDEVLATRRSMRGESLVGSL